MPVEGHRGAIEHGGPSTEGYHWPGRPGPPRMGCRMTVAPAYPWVSRTMSGLLPHESALQYEAGSEIESRPNAQTTLTTRMTLEC